MTLAIHAPTMLMAITRSITVNRAKRGVRSDRLARFHCNLEILLHNETAVLLEDKRRIWLVWFQGKTSFLMHVFH